MSDIAGTLLAQYYGFFKKSKPEKFLSIHECANNTENNVHKLIEQSIANANDDGDDTSKETESQIIENDETEKNKSEDVLIRSSRILEQEDTIENDEETSKFDIIFKKDTSNNFNEEDTTFSNKKAKDLVLYNTNTISTILDPDSCEALEDGGNRNDLYLSLNEDVLSDSTSDILSTERKKSSRSSTKFISSLNFTFPSQDKTPMYNETFIDLASTGLVSLPEIIQEYLTIRMLYLENNNLTELPYNLFVSLPQLQWLDIRNNQLTNLPTSIRSHPSLETVLLERNKIQKLPLELCLVPKLKILNVAHNPIIEPPEDIIALGCSSILNYLRAEWNKLHPNESVKFMKPRIEPKLSTILCYQSPREKRLKLPKIPRRISKSANDIGDSSKNTSIRKRNRAYKPSNRCDSKGINFTPEQRMYWISKAKDLLSAQSKTIQKIKDSDVIKEWRRDKRSYNKSMEKVLRRNEDDIPFAIDIEDYPTIRKYTKKSPSKNQIQERLQFIPPININKKLLEMSKSLQKLEIIESETLTPKSKQKHLQIEIEKLSHFKKEIGILKRYNEVLTPMNSPNNSS